MSTKVTLNNVVVDAENATEITAKGAVSIVSEEQQEKVVSRKKQYSIVGDALYLSVNTDDPPEWLEDIISTITSQQYGEFSSLLGGVQNSFLSALNEIELAKNSYTEALNIYDSVEGVVVSHLTGINASVNNLQSQFVDLRTVVATDLVTTANRVTSLESSIGESEALNIQMSGTLARLGTDLTNLNKYVDDKYAHLDEVMAYEYSLLMAKNAEIVTSIYELETAIADKIGALASDIKALEIIDVNNKTTLARVEDFNIAIATHGSKAQASAGSGFSAISSENSSSTLDFAEVYVNRNQGGFEARSTDVNWVVAGPLKDIINAMEARIQGFRDAANAITATDDASEKLKTSYLNQVTALTVRKNYVINNQNTMTAHPDHKAATHFGSYFGEYFTTRKAGADLKTGGYHFKNDGKDVSAYYHVDKMHFGRPDSTGKHPVSIIDGDLQFNDLKYRTVDVVRDTGTTTITLTVTTGKTYVFTSSSKRKVNITYKNPPQGARFDIIAGGAGDIEIGLAVTGGKNVYSKSGATFIFANNVWYSVGAM